MSLLFPPTRADSSRQRMLIVWDWRFKGHSVFRQLQLWFGQLHTSDPKHLLLCSRRTGTSGGSASKRVEFHVSAPETRRRPKSEGWRGTVQRGVAARVSAGASAAFALRGLAALISFIKTLYLSYL